MRAYLASSIAVTCAAALALPLSLATANPAGARPAAATSSPESADAASAGLANAAPWGADLANARRASAEPAGARRENAHGASAQLASAQPASLQPGSAQSASLQPASAQPASLLPASLQPASAQPASPDLAGSTQSLPLEPLAPDGAPRGRGSVFAAPAERGLTRREVRPFSLVGVVWDDARVPLHGSVQVRTRAAADGAWSQWQDVETHNEEHGADPNTAEGRSGARHGSTAPLWVGDSNGVEIRVHPEYRATHTLPAGLRLELVDPGPDTERAAGAYDAMESADVTAAAAGSTATRDASLAETLPDAADDTVPALAPGDGTVLPALTRAQTLATLPGVTGVRGVRGVTGAGRTRALAKAPYIGPRPKIITRKGWGADEGMRERGFVYTKTIKAAFVHHSATGNNYSCRQAPAVLRSIYRYHVKSLGWRDFGYNFAVDKCGNIYEGRAGGVGKAVMGAHTLGFNTNSMGIAVLGTYGSTTPPAAAVSAIARLTAWKLGLYGVNPNGTTYLTSGGGNLYKKGKKVKFHVIAGHRDGFATECPGVRLYNKLGTARSASAKYQGRR
ncbi:N-acetylmuramoyl-L-alanine amidase [Streptomyces sp. NPDC101160]|uniref:peptidoglycan recognition protein family protein n=1 Tax=Streptomyces sp. NPDC101160 TaxID=3366118 RepID=UPI003823B0A7